MSKTLDYHVIIINVQIPGTDINKRFIQYKAPKLKPFVISQ
jgi:hypothetical protein